MMLAVIGLLSGCGLEFNMTSLEPPNTPDDLASPGTPIFTIEVPAAEKELEFRGYELYYKFYANLADIQQNLQNVTEYELRSSHGFRQVCTAADTYTGSSNLHTHKPLIFVETFDRNRAFLITVTFAPPEQPSVLYDGDPYEVSVRRNVPDTVLGSPNYGEPKPFIQLDAAFPAYQAADTDIQGIWATVKPVLEGGTGEAYLAMYALSYGIVDITTDIYSTPVYLGYVRIETNQ
jgi:hypothetical protein